jgi:hypothetical protein
MSRCRIPCLTLLVTSVIAAGSATATDRYYPNIVETSPDGRLRLEVKSPENSAGNVAFAANFVYTLYQVSSSNVVWSREQPKLDRKTWQQDRHEGSPMAAFVHDSGYVVVRTAGDELMVLDTHGRVAVTVPIFYTFPQAEQEKHIRWTTAGPVWSQNTHWYYFTVTGKLYFGVRTWWDRRVVICLPDAKQVMDEGPVREAAAAAEREFTIATLRRASETARQSLAKGLPEYGDVEDAVSKQTRQLGAAINLASRMGIQEMAPLLRDLERVPHFNSSCSGGGDETPAGQVMVGSYRYDGWRSQFQLAIRRLGGTPLGRPTKEMIVAEESRLGGRVYHPKPHTTPRADRVPAMNKSMTTKEVVDTVGEPDYILSAWPAADAAWEYDIDAAKPYTLRVVWKDSKIVRTERIDPPVWKDGITRDMQD